MWRLQTWKLELLFGVEVTAGKQALVTHDDARCEEWASSSQKLILALAKFEVCGKTVNVHMQVGVKGTTWDFAAVMKEARGLRQP